MKALFVAGLLLVGFDVARLNMTGVAVLGVVFITITMWSAGVFTRGFWIADESLHLGDVDVDIDRGAR